MFSTYQSKLQVRIKLSISLSIHSLYLTGTTENRVHHRILIINITKPQYMPQLMQSDRLNQCPSPTLSIAKMNRLNTRYTTIGRRQIRMRNSVLPD